MELFYFYIEDFLEHQKNNFSSKFHGCLFEFLLIVFGKFLYIFMIGMRFWKNPVRKKASILFSIRDLFKNLFGLKKSLIISYTSAIGLFLSFNFFFRTRFLTIPIEWMMAKRRLVMLLTTVQVPKLATIHGIVCFAMVKRRRKSTQIGRRGDTN